MQRVNVVGLMLINFGTNLDLLIFILQYHQNNSPTFFAH